MTFEHRAEDREKIKKKKKKSVVYLEALGATARLFCASGIFARTKISVFAQEYILVCYMRIITFYSFTIRAYGAFNFAPVITC